MSKKTKTKSKFYIVTKGNWIGQKWKPVAGPFTSRKTAQARTSKHQYAYIGPRGLDLKSQKHTKVVSRTWLTRHGFPNTPQGRANLTEALCDAKR